MCSAYFRAENENTSKPQCAVFAFFSCFPPPQRAAAATIMKRFCHHPAEQGWMPFVVTKKGPACLPFNDTTGLPAGPPPHLVVHYRRCNRPTGRPPRRFSSLLHPFPTSSPVSSTPPCSPSKPSSSVRPWYTLTICLFFCAAISKNARKTETTAFLPW